MSRIEKYLQQLYAAEFESGEYEDEANPKEMIKLLKRAYNWKNHSNLQDVCTHLGAECDDRVETIEGCKEIIMEEIEYWKAEI